MAKKKNVKDIQIGDKIVLLETGFEYVVTYITEKSILIKSGIFELWLPKMFVQIMDSLLSTSNYRLFKLKSLPDWFVEKNNIK